MTQVLVWKDDKGCNGMLILTSHTWFSVNCKEVFGHASAEILLSSAFRSLSNSVSTVCVQHFACNDVALSYSETDYMLLLGWKRMSIQTIRALLVAVIWQAPALLQNRHSNWNIYSELETLLKAWDCQLLKLHFWFSFMQYIYIKVFLFRGAKTYPSLQQTRLWLRFKVWKNIQKVNLQHPLIRNTHGGKHNSWWVWKTGGEMQSERERETN